MCVIELEPCEVWTVTKIKRARLPHECGCCGRTIEPGQGYTGVFSIFEGDRNYEKSCAQCWAAQEAFADAHAGTIGQPSGFTDLLDECMLDGDEETETRWRPMREGIVNKWGLTSR